MLCRTTHLSIPFLLAAAVVVYTEELPRDGRWLWGKGPGATVTNLVTRKQFVTELEPSSCVIADPTLSPCRNIRQLKLIQPTETIPIDRSIAPQGVPQPIYQPHVPGRPTHPLRQFVQPSEHENTGMWSWFRSPPLKTIFHTVIEPATVRRHDPNTVVTFSIRGCRPTRLPFDLSICPDNVSGAARSDGEEIGSRSDQHLDVHYAMEEEQGKEQNN